MDSMVSRISSWIRQTANSGSVGLGRCEQDFAAWAEKHRNPTDPEAWAKLTQPDMMLWLAHKRGLKFDEGKLRLFACDCVEKILPDFENNFPDENRPRNAINSVRLFVANRITASELKEAAIEADRAGKFCTRSSSEVESWAIRNPGETAAFAARDAAETNFKPMMIATSTAIAHARATGRRERAKFGTDGKTAMSRGWRAANRWQAKRLRHYFPNPFGTR